MRKSAVLAALALAMAALPSAATAKSAAVNRHWVSLYAYDADGDWYYMVEPGRVYGTVDDVADLDQATLSRCDYVNNSRGSFGDDYLDDGWVTNSINCSGYDGRSHWTYLIVHRTDPRYTGDPNRVAWEFGPAWEYKVLNGSHYGSLLRFSEPV